MAHQVPEARSNRIIRRREVEHRVGLSRSAIYRRMAEGTFPKPVKIGQGKAVGWVEGEIDELLVQCIAQRDGVVA